MQEVGTTHREDGGFTCTGEVARLHSMSEEDSWDLSDRVGVSLLVGDHGEAM